MASSFFVTAPEFSNSSQFSELSIGTDVRPRLIEYGHTTVVHFSVVWKKVLKGGIF